jgi:hypothetical protein
VYTLDFLAGDFLRHSAFQVSVLILNLHLRLVLLLPGPLDVEKAPFTRVSFQNSFYKLLHRPFSAQLHSIRTAAVAIRPAGANQLKIPLRFHALFLLFANCFSSGFSRSVEKVPPAG